MSAYKQALLCLSVNYLLQWKAGVRWWSVSPHWKLAEGGSPHILKEYLGSWISWCHSPIPQLIYAPGRPDSYVNDEEGRQNCLDFDETFLYITLILIRKTHTIEILNFMAMVCRVREIKKSFVGMTNLWKEIRQLYCL